jgi:uncharacterized membrane protein YedE/YeeE
MTSLLELLRTDPWPWYVTGPMIGLMVPLLLWVGNHLFGVSSSLRHVCAATVPCGLPYFSYDWRKDLWNLWFVAGIAVGGVVAAVLLQGGGAEPLAPAMVERLQAMGLSGSGDLLPRELFDSAGGFGGIGWGLVTVGGFLVGFGARYAGGCTGGHTIAGIATLQRASIIASIAFFIGGLVTVRWFLPALWDILK